MRTVIDHLTDIVAAVDAAQAFVKDMDLVAFHADQRTQYAVTHALEIVGEATKRIPEAVRARYPCAVATHGWHARSSYSRLQHC